MRTSKLILTVIGLLGSAAAVAGPFCLVIEGMAPNCRFYDETSCAQAAVAANGGCVEKRLRGTQLAPPLSVAPKDAGYCLVGHGDAKCYYFDAQSCAKAAQIEGEPVSLGRVCLLLSAKAARSFACRSASSWVHQLCRETIA